MASAANKHDREDTTFVVVPMANGFNPPNWPQPFNRSIMAGMPGQAMRQLLGDYGMNVPQNQNVRVTRNTLARHIGTRGF